jgi:hypothetical protein
LPPRQRMIALIPRKLHALRCASFIKLLEICVLLVRLQAALLRAVGKPMRELVKVDLDGRIEELGLGSFLPVSAWPSLAAVRELATKVRALKRSAPDRTTAPFASRELRKCVWWFPVFVCIRTPSWRMCQVSASTVQRCTPRKGRGNHWCDYLSEGKGHRSQVGLVGVAVGFRQARLVVYALSFTGPGGT